MRHVDDDAEPIAAADDLGAGGREAAMDGVLGLDVAEFVDPVMRQLQVAELPARVGFVDPVRVALQEVAALGRDHDAGLGGAGGVQRGGGGDDRHALLRGQSVQPGEGGLRVGVELARVWVAERVDAVVGRHPVGGRVGDDGQASDGQAAFAHGRRDGGEPRGSF